MPARASEHARRCELCGREVPPALITLHHLTPKQKGGKAEHRVEMCKPCHKQIHALFSNTELANVLNTLTKLQQAPQLQGFLTWIRKQRGDRTFRTHLSHAHPKARSRR